MHLKDPDIGIEYLVPRRMVVEIISFDWNLINTNCIGSVVVLQAYKESIEIFY